MGGRQVRERERQAAWRDTKERQEKDIREVWKRDEIRILERQEKERRETESTLFI